MTTRPRISTVYATGALLALAALDATAADTGTLYNFGLNEKHTNVTFTSEADVENIYGMCHVASGTTWLDLETGKGKARIVVPVKHMKTGIDERDEHLRSDAWLDEEKHPEIVFVSDGFDITAKNRDKGVYEAKVKGTITIKGVKRDIETTARIVAVAEKSAKAAGLGDGKWVRVTASFDVPLADFDVKVPDGPVQGKVSPIWAVKFDCYAGEK